jgi:hypothetical protein
LCSASEIDGKKSKNDCENSDDDRADGNDFLMKFSDETSSDPQADFERGVRGGAVIFFGLIGMGLFAVLYWAAITR